MSVASDNGSSAHRSPSVTSGGQAGVDDRHSDIYFAAIETTRMPMILTDPNQPDNPIVFANVAFLKMTGYEIEEIAGRNCRFLQGPETDREVVSAIRTAVESMQDFTGEILNYRKDGTTFWNALFISPVFDKVGKLVYFFASQLDVSRRRDAEDALRQAQKMEAIGQLTGGIAHDFNNLLQVIMGYTEGLRDKLNGLGDARMIRQIGAVSDAATRASTLTQQLLAFSRKQKLEGRIINLNSLVQSMGDLASRTLGGDVLIEQRLAPDLWNAKVDPTQAEMALLNILINARDAISTEGRVVIETSNHHVETGAVPSTGLLLAAGDYVSVAVSDNGVGMPETVLKRVMDPFFTTKEEGKGTGLGLSMVYGFVKQSGGTVRITSEVGEGTKVQLFFPSTQQAPNLAGARTMRASDRGGTERILVVDDRLEVAELASTMLQDAGYDVEVAGNGAEALDKLDRDTPYQLLFSDLIMPGGMNGVVLAREATHRHPGLRVLLTTGFAEASLERTDVGGEEYDTLVKPYRRTDLLRRVRIILDGPTGTT